MLKKRKNNWISLTPLPLKKITFNNLPSPYTSNYLSGKSEISGLKGNKNHYGKELAEMGFVTFVPDAISFEERNFLNKNQALNIMN